MDQRQKLLRDLLLAHQRQGDVLAVGGQEADARRAGAERGVFFVRAVRDDHVEVLAFELLTRALDQVFGLQREAYQHVFALALSNLGEDVGCLVKLQASRLPRFGLLHLLLSRSRAEIAHRRRRDDHLAGVISVADSAQHLVGGLTGTLLVKAGRVASAGDNAAMESWNALLQKNVLNRRRWRTREELHQAIVFWTEHTYNRRRRQRALGKLTPVEFELAFTTQNAAIAA